MNKSKQMLYTLRVLFAIAFMVSPLSVQPNIVRANHAFVTVVDDLGSNDQPNQKDLTKLEVDDSHAGQIYVNWNWDETSSFAGANTGDACSLFDTDNDGLVNYALCVTIQDDAFGVPQQVAASPRLYSCSESPASVANRRCTSSVQMTPITSICAVTSPSADDPFATDPVLPNDGPGDDFPNDTKASCTFNVADVAPNTNVTLLNVCSYPSQIPNSDPSDCVVTPGRGFLTIIKNAGSDTTTNFGFNVVPPPPGTGGSYAITGSGSVQLIPVDSATNYAITELVPAGWNLQSASCVVAGSSTGTFSGSTISNVDIRPGLETVCTFTNALSQGHIIIDKVTNPAGSPQSFNFDASGGSYADFSLADATAPNDQALSPGTYTVQELLPTGWKLTSLTCTDPSGNTTTSGSTATINLAAGETVNCTFTNAPIPPGSIDVVKTASPTSFTEPGGTATFNVVVNNTSAETPVTINALGDNVYGNLNGQGTCSVPQTIPVGGNYACSFTGAVSGAPGSSHTDIATASGTDSIGNPVSDSDDAVVTITDSPSSIKVTKTANPTSLPEPGGTVAYQVLIENTSAVDSVTINSLSDNKFGNQTGSCTPALPATIAPGGTITCNFNGSVTGNAGTTHTNVATASGTDDDGNPVSGTDDAVVTITDTPSSIKVTKTANPTSVAEPGGTVVYQVFVENTSAVDSVTINSLSDDKFGNQTGSCTPALPATIAPGGTITCNFNGSVTGNGGTTHTNVATASGTDDDGNPVSGNDDAVVTITDVPSSIKVTKTANPTSINEPGGTVNFTVLIENTSAADSVTINSLTDDKFGNLDGQGTCDVPQTIPVGGSYSCTFSGAVSGNAGATHTNVATASGTDDDGQLVSGNDDAVVTFLDVPSSIKVTKTANPTSVPETGGTVAFTVLIENTSVADSVTINSLSDDKFGNLTSTCGLPVTLAPGGSKTCTFSQTLSGDFPGSHTNVATASGTDDDGQPVSDDDDAVVDFTDVLPDITLVKTANPTSVPETGGNVTFSFAVTNNGAEAVTLTTLTDSVFGNLDGQGTCAVPQAIAAGGTYTCTITKFISGNAGTKHTNVGTATGEDDDGNTDTDDDDEDVPFTDVKPTLEVVKTASPTSVPETGGAVNFSFAVKNTGLETVILTSLNDNTFGNLDGQGTCSLPQMIAPGATYTCSVTKSVSGNAGTSHVNVVTATGQDDEGNVVSDDDDATVTFSDVKPAIMITKSASPSSVPETGGNVVFTFIVKNIGLESVTMTSLTDSKFGDLNGQGTCATGGTLAPGATYTCSVMKTISGDFGNDHTNVATVKATDDEGNEATDDDDETVTFTDVKPAIKITKSASPSSVPESGGSVVFTFVVENIGLESVTMTSLTDSKFGNLNGQGTCATGGTLAPGGTYTCSVTKTISGDFGNDHTNVATVKATDDEGNEAMDDDDETVTFTDVKPTVALDKSVTPSTRAEPGGAFNFTLKVTNTSAEPVVITALTDSKSGSATGYGTCTALIGTTLAAGASVTCSYSVIYTDAGSYLNTAAVTVKDDEGNPASATDQETVTVTDVLPKIDVIKTANPTSVLFTGGSVAYTFQVKNLSVESVTLTSLVDDKFGNLNGQGTCSVPQTLAVGGTYTCTITKFLSGAPGGSHTNIVIGTAKDNENNIVTDPGTATVTFFWRGRTPGYWKNKPAEWPANCVVNARTLATTTRVQDVFNVASYLTSGILDLNKDGRADTLFDALGYQGGSTLDGKAQILLRAAVAGLLNECTFGATYPPYTSTTELLNAVNAALVSRNGTTIINLATTIDGWNNGVH